MTGRRIPPDALKESLLQRFTVLRTILPRAEGEGFEPSVDLTAHNGFRDRGACGRFSGLGAGLRALETGCAALCAALSPGFLPATRRSTGTTGR
jgi:hypothetical protein